MIHEDLPRVYTRGAGHERLVTRAEAASALGYSITSMAAVMRRSPQRWPRPVALLRHGRVWQLLWDLDELEAAAPRAEPGARLGSVATITDPDGILTCLECGGRYRSLGAHLARAHDMTGAEYRERHRLPATGALMADAGRAEQSVRMYAEIAEDPDAIAHLAPYQDRGRLDRMRAEGVESIRRTVGYESVRASRRPGQRYAAQVMAGSRLARLDERVRARGFDGVLGAVRATMHLSGRRAAEVTGLSATSVYRYRARLRGGT